MDDLGPMQLGYHPSVVNFTRRAAIRSGLLDSASGEANEAREMAPYHEDYSNLPVNQARAQVNRAIEKLSKLLLETSEQDPDRFTLEFLANALQSSTVSKFLQVMPEA